MHTNREELRGNVKIQEARQVAKKRHLLLHDRRSLNTRHKDTDRAAEKEKIHTSPRDRRRAPMRSTKQRTAPKGKAIRVVVPAYGDSEDTSKQRAQ